MKNLIIAAICFFITIILYGQDFQQTVRGKVIDKESHAPIAFATVTVTNNGKSQGTITDEKGSFKIEHVPVGRKTLNVSFLGYETVTIPNLDVTMGKEMLVNIEMIEQAVQIEEVKVKAFQNKEKPNNSFAPISARKFTIEESQRYAGSGNDVSRMAMNFAGVNQTVETFNEIVVRGNSPVSVLFRLEGVDIPNPNHFGDGGDTGGPMSMLNNNVLANSDFMTGAFPAEYDNTISSVFDLTLRNGNNQQHEFMAQTGLMGLELGAEGPVSESNNSSYLINYRYTNAAFLNALGMDLMGTAQFAYQDVTFKFNFPTQKMGTLSIFGLGGKSIVKMFDSERDTSKERLQMAYESPYELDMLNDNYNGVIGLSHAFLLDNTAYTKFILSATSINNFNEFDSLSTVNRKTVMLYHSEFSRTNYAARFYINKKIDGQKSFRTGVSAKLQTFNLLDSLYDGSNEVYRNLRDFKGHQVIPSAFFQYKQRFANNIQIIAGVNATFQPATEHHVLEPRCGIKWDLLPKNTLSLGYGLHSMLTPIEMLQQQYRLPDGTNIQPNAKLGFTKSHHYVLGYDRMFEKNILLKAEIYYQYIYDALVDEQKGSYSILNHGSYDVSSIRSVATDVGHLANSGKGYNYGLEITAEKFMDKGMYFLSTLSLYESKYRGSDKVLRNSAFNGQYVYNLLGGKEFKIGKNKDNAKFLKRLVLDGKINWAGGQRYTPFDLESSRKYGTTVLKEDQAFSKQLPPYFRIDFRAGFKWIGKGSTQEIALDITNLTNRENPFYITFNPETGQTETKGFGMMPEFLYRISF